MLPHHRQLKEDVLSGKIPANANVASHHQYLDDADSYIGGLYGNLHKAQKQNGTTVVRMGISGTGRRPSYRIEHPDGTEPDVPFDGQTHRPFTDTVGVAAATWSSEVNSFEEIEALLGKIRKFTRGASGR